MKITIIGSRCKTCSYYTQYYSINRNGELEEMDLGYCGKKQGTTNPGRRCKEHFEKGNAGKGEVESLYRNILMGKI